MPTISMTCPSCQKGFKRRTRKALRTSCPHCGHVMPGPEGQKLVEARLQALEEQRARRRERERKPTGPPAAPAAAPPARRRRSSPAKAEGQPPPAAPGTETQVPRHPESKPPPPEDRHPSLIF